MGLSFYIFGVSFVKNEISMIKIVIKINDVSRVLLHCLKHFKFACEQLFFKMFFFHIKCAPFLLKIGEDF